jgi:hypothetical protein
MAWNFMWNFIGGLIDTRVFRKNVDKPSGTLSNRLEALVGLGGNFADFVLFQCSKGFGSLSKNPRKYTTTYYNVRQNLPAL